ncbi:MAG: nucleotidyltransferase domain-containing protein [Deltaproteobacteria bacterium]|nr:nucleotidyltransferase domain-containing protein [Deltaproteobacteria bacterium]
MKSSKIKKTLYNTPLWKVLGCVLHHPDLMMRGSQITTLLPNISQSSIYNAIRALEKIGVLIREKNRDGFSLNIDHAWLRYLMVADTLLTLQPLIQTLAPIAVKVLLFGSRATGQYTSTSDYDLFVVSARDREVRRKLSQSTLKRHVQLILKTPEEWLDLRHTEPEFYQSLQQGIVLWDRK